MQSASSGARAWCFPSTLFVAFVSATLTYAQQTGLTLDANGNITLISSKGDHTILAEHSHCNEIRGTPDGEMLVCFVSRGADDHGFLPQFEIEIYHADGQKQVLGPGGPIREWHFWDEDRQIALSFTASNGHISDALYDAQTGNLVETVEEPAVLSHLPQWAKTQLQIDDESVPTDERSQEMESKWLAKTFRQIESIMPGMHRRDLDSLFRHDGGIQFGPSEDRYVFKACSLIKIDVRFALTAKSADAFHENPDDVITSVSKPYLEYPMTD